MANKLSLKQVIALAACVIIGITLVASGTGKLFDGTPAQIVDFLSHVIPEVLLTPGTITFVFEIFIPYIVPLAEFILGLLLLIGVAPRLIAILCLPLFTAFLGTNIWSIFQGDYATCASCFGFWERIFGSLTPLQSLIYDVVLLMLAIIVITLHSGQLLSNRRWLSRFWQRFQTSMQHRVPEHLPTFYYAYLKLKQTVIQHRKAAFGTGILIVIVVITVLAVLSSRPAKIITPIPIPPVVTDIAVSQISYESAVITWASDRPSISRIIIYDNEGNVLREVIDSRLALQHHVTISDLSSETSYYFEVCGDKSTAAELLLSYQNSFVTQTPEIIPLIISNVRVSLNTDSSAVITWQTNKPTRSTIEYWIEGSEEHLIITNDNFQTEHSEMLSDLDKGARYHFFIKATDSEGNQGITESEHVFTQSIGTGIGMQAPDFSLYTIGGETITLSTLRGKAVLLDFWVWTCPACRIKLPMIQEIYNSLTPEKITVLSIHYKGSEAIIRNFAAKQALTLPILIDQYGLVSDLYQVKSYPTVYLLDQDGIVRLYNPQFDSSDELKFRISESLENN